ncbi:MAG: alpha/beta fold hydrolase [Actinomycetota bacterium]|nr:alpha/beta fold hydrolase [Actinomycetota bacterium]
MKIKLAIGHLRKATRAIGAFTAGVLLLGLFFPFLSGCAPKEERSYVLEESGIIIGTDIVKVHRDGSSICFSGEEQRPYRQEETVIKRELIMEEKTMSLLDYNSKESVPGATFETTISEEGGSYSLFADYLTTFEYLPGFSNEKLLPFEPQSVCLTEALISRFLASGHDESKLKVVVCSRCPMPADVTIRKKDDGHVLIESNQTGRLKVQIGKDGRVENITSREGWKLLTASPRTLKSRPYAPQEKAERVEEVAVTTVDGKKLAGSLYLPKKKSPYPGVVLLSDIPPHDRTGGGLLSQIADSLAGDGMAALICDKRGIPPSEGTFGQSTLLTDINDLNSQVEYLAYRGDIDRDAIYVVGHGGGGLVSILSAIDNPYIGACVLLGAPSVPLFPDLLIARVNLAEERGTLTSEEAQFKRQEIASLSELIQREEKSEVKLGKHTVSLEWMRSYMGIDISSVVGLLEIPVLVVHGENDEAVPVGQAYQIYDALKTRQKGEEEIEIIPGVDHFFGPLVVKPPYREHPKISRRVPDLISYWLMKKDEKGGK